MQDKKGCEGLNLAKYEYYDEDTYDELNDHLDFPVGWNATM